MDKTPLETMPEHGSEAEANTCTTKMEMDHIRKVTEATTQ